MKRRPAILAVTLALLAGMLPIGRPLQAQSSPLEAAETYFSEGPRTIKAADLYENLNDGDPENDPTIISLR
ncbi:MAG: hypothetical protein PVG71_11605, partial [Anaerolineae bacterium]